MPGYVNSCIIHIIVLYSFVLNFNMYTFEHSLCVLSSMVYSKRLELGWSSMHRMIE